MTLRERLQAWRYNLIPDHIIGEILQKRWTDNAIPFLALVITVAVFGSAISGFFNLMSLQASTRQLGEFILVVIGLSVVMLGGGIDLAVGSIFALGAFAAVTCFFIFHLPTSVAFLAALVTGIVFGAVNGYLIGYLRLRAFLTTLVTFIIGRALYEILVVNFGSKVQLSDASSDMWDFIGDGTILGLSVSMFVALVLAVVTHIALTRSRPGWHVLAVGGSRRSAHNAGIRVRHTVFLTYVFSGACSAVAGFLIATRLSGAGPGTGQGLEILALTAAVVGGNSLGGGRGSVAKGLMGAVIVLVMTNGLIRLGYGTGTNQMVLGLLLAAAVTIDIRWLKNRHKVLNEVYVAPVYLRLGKAESAEPGSGTQYELNNQLSEASAIGLGELEGPEDVILDRDENLYCGTRHGEIIRFFAPDYTRHEVFAHIGGFPLGLAFDRDENLLSCVGAMGLYKIAPDGEVTRLSAETRRSLTSIQDDARLRDPNDLDIAPDGKIYFTDSTKRYDAHEWAIDSIENRGTGRLLVYDPATDKTTTLLDGYRYTNGVAMAHDNKSLLFCESWANRIHRYWLEGPKAGTAECVIRDMPGYPDNINRASDGNYWMAWLGMRTPSFDLSLRHPGMRKRMARRLPQDEWLFPNINTGGIVKFNDKGEILQTFGDLSGQSHPMVTSIREHKGELFIGGILNNRIGRFKIEGADPNWTALDEYWGKRP
ncbi:ABC transporter permease [Aquicoccus sp. G2-2]|uniref:ABC transporter permease n=1 Tax=Aquicoccus sp. G2-2 TaxID=3092120 RepID=UPI002AE04146|nr:SMP-30/gluconolactonase/LRE family protein [Aquicoccus sp. G2-2]MEA1113227.1 SMP-30/gluconolactonase/LRE family protein [Aquicoccus sp. G2-2]